MRILVVNSGSSSLKLAAVVDGRVADERALPPLETMIDDEIADAVEGLGPFDAVGHRVVHGGGHYVEPTIVDTGVRDALASFQTLAPLHQAAAIRGIDLLRRVQPGCPAVACFDTAFHASLPPAAATYAIPERWRSLGVRKYGFHGLAHASTCRRVATVVGERARLVSCHLGAGASLAAVVAGRCVDTTMGFTPLDGLVMATRSGSIDPGAVLWLQREAGLDASTVDAALHHESGLTALAGTGDMRVLLRRRAEGDRAATLAVEIYLHRLCGAIAAMTAAAGGIDALSFSGGVGENAPAIRTAVADRLAFFGVTIDAARNATSAEMAELTGDGPVRVLVVPAEEQLEIARGVTAALARH